MDEYVKEYVRLSQEKDQIQEQLDSVKTQMKSYMESCGLSKSFVEDRKILYQPCIRETIDKGKLMRMAPKTAEKCIKQTTYMILLVK